MDKYVWFILEMQTGRQDGMYPMEHHTFEEMQRRAKDWDEQYPEYNHFVCKTTPDACNCSKGVKFLQSKIDRRPLKPKNDVFFLRWMERHASMPQ